MAELDLGPFGFGVTLAVHGNVEAAWAGGGRLLFLFGENHRDRDMIRLNVLNALALVDRGIVGCAGTEIPFDDLARSSDGEVRSRSEALFRNHQTDTGVIDHLNQCQPGWYGGFGFGNTLKVLRPALDVRCVEAAEVRARMKPISDAYIAWDLLGGEPPFPGYPNMGDHPLNYEREEAMLAGLVAMWEVRIRDAPAAILNTGFAHSRRLCDLARARDIAHIYLAIPGTDLRFGVV